MEKQLVIFELAEEYFGIDISSVESIIKIQEITPVPKAPDYMEGITNFRGSILPVMNLKKRFSLTFNEITNDTRIIVVTMDVLKIGMIVDSVSEVLTIEDNNIETTPPMISTVDTQFISGICKIDRRLVILLDLAKVLSKKEQQQAASLLK